MAFRLLEHPELFSGAKLVSNNHFDQDGLAGLYAFVRPDDAVRRHVSSRVSPMRATSR